jgi:hypothetical protein
MAGQLMERVEFGFPELSLVCGALLYGHDSAAIGITLCVIAVLGAACRSIIRIQKKVQEEEAKQALFKEVGTASEDLAQAFSEIFKKPGKPKTFH